MLKNVKNTIVLVLMEHDMVVFQVEVDRILQVMRIFSHSLVEGEEVAHRTSILISGIFLEVRDKEREHPRARNPLITKKQNQKKSHSM